MLMCHTCCIKITFVVGFEEMKSETEDALIGVCTFAIERFSIFNLN